MLASPSPTFSGKTVVITGSSRGLGLEMGRRFAAADARVILTDVDSEQGARAAESLRDQGAEARFEQLDVRSPEQSVSLVEQLVKEFGSIDVWVNNAGVAHKAAAESLPVDEWRESIDVMLSGAFYCSQSVSGPMLKRGQGVIVNIEGSGGAARAQINFGKFGMKLLDLSVAKLEKI